MFVLGDGWMSGNSNSALVCGCCGYGIGAKECHYWRLAVANDGDMFVYIVCEDCLLNVFAVERTF